MSEVFKIDGPVAVSGKVVASGAKNAALPLIIATLLTDQPCVIENVPAIHDIGLLLSLLERLGAESAVHPVDGLGLRISVRVPKLVATEAPYSLVKSMRASFWVLAPLLARGRSARVALPGGDIIGARPVDLHLAALEQMGAEIKIKHGVVLASAPNGLKPAEIELRFPSVGATHQILMAASLIPGQSVLKGAAREPEVSALVDMLVLMGAQITGRGSSELVINGCAELGGATVRVISDRIEIGTFLLLAAASRGRIKIERVDPEPLAATFNVLRDMGCMLEVGTDSVVVDASRGMKAVTVSTEPFPGFPTDLQAPLVAALTVAEGESVIEEGVFEGRFGHVAELCRMGAKITVSDRTLRITGVPSLSGAPVEAHDIRAGAALVIAANCAVGSSHLAETHHLRRGYEQFENKLASLGVKISLCSGEYDDQFLVGC